MKFLELKKSLNKPKSIYSLVGDDEFLLSQALRIIKEELVTSFEEFNYTKIDLENTKVSDYKNILNTMPFGDSYRVVVFSMPNIEQVRAINQLTNQDLERVIIVCIQPAFKVDRAENIDCNHLGREDLIKWLNNYFFKLNIKIEKKAFDYIIDLSENDMSYLNSELSKLIAYTNNKTITIKDVDEIFTKNKNYFIYHLSSSIDNKDKKAQFDILNALTLSQNIGDIFMFLGSYFRRMFYCSVSKLNSEELASLLKVKPYAIEKAKQFVNKNKPKYYIDLYNKYIELDYSIKLGDISYQNAMYELLLNIEKK